jgi:hypothetical protein
VRDEGAAHVAVPVGLRAAQAETLRPRGLFSNTNFLFSTFINGKICKKFRLYFVVLACRVRVDFADVCGRRGSIVQVHECDAFGQVDLK